MKRTLCVILSVLLVLCGLSGCGKKADKAGSGAAQPAVSDLVDPKPSSVREDPPEEPQEAPPEEVPQRPYTTTFDYPVSEVTDDILILVNKTHPLAEDYRAEDMVTVSSCDPGVGTKETRMMRKVAADALEVLIDGAAKDGFDIVMRTGYRSYDYQANLFASYAAKHGEEQANTYSARPGQSEHQTGLCCDVGVPGKSLTSFNGSKEADWLAENCWRYGFILRYPADKTDITGYIYESWHIRYVGEEVASIMHEEGIATFEEYLGIL